MSSAVRRITLLAAIGLGGGTVGAPAASPADASVPCRVDLRITPRDPYVGQQVLHRVVIATGPEVDRIEWVQPPSFPDHRVEALPAIAAPDRNEADTGGWRMREERRALFAGRSGRLVVPPTRLSCIGEAEDGGDARAWEIEIPARSVDVRATPSIDRPADYGELIGPVDLSRSVDRKRVVLGEALQLTVGLHGANNVWTASLDPPLARAGEPRFDVFPAGERSDSAKTDRWSSRRVARFDIVPRRAGTLVLPAWSVAWLDPDTGRYHTSESAPITIDVAPPGEAAVPDRTPDTTTPAARGFDSASESPAGSRPDPERSLLRTLGAAVLVAAAAFLAGGLLFRARLRRRAVDSALASAAAARLSGDRRGQAEALERAVRAALAERSPALAGLSPPELAARAGDDEHLAEAARLLADIEDARFGAAPRPVDPDAIRSWLSGGTRGPVR